MADDPGTFESSVLSLALFLLPILDCRKKPSRFRRCPVGPLGWVSAMRAMEGVGCAIAHPSMRPHKITTSSCSNNFKAGARVASLLRRCWLMKATPDQSKDVKLEVGLEKPGPKSNWDQSGWRVPSIKAGGSPIQSNSSPRTKPFEPWNSILCSKPGIWKPATVASKCAADLPRVTVALNKCLCKT